MGVIRVPQGLLYLWTSAWQYVLGHPVYQNATYCKNTVVFDEDYWSYLVVVFTVFTFYRRQTKSCVAWNVCSILIWMRNNCRSSHSRIVNASLNCSDFFKSLTGQNFAFLQNKGLKSEPINAWNAGKEFKRFSPARQKEHICLNFERYFLSQITSRLSDQWFSYPLLDA